MGREQRFTFGYHLNSWDLGGLDLEEGLRFIHQAGFGWFEALARDGFSGDFVRRFMRVGEVDPPEPTTDTAFLTRIALFSKIQEELGLRLSSLYCNVELVNSHTWRQECACLTAILRLLRGFGAPGLVIGGGPPAVPGRPLDPAIYRSLARSLAEIGAIAGEQLDLLMDHLDTSACGLCIDPAHLVLAGSDPVAVVRDYGSAIRYVHYKDTYLPEGAVDGARYAAFCELGAGAVDLVGMTDQLLGQGYDGLAIIELDVSAKTAQESALESVAFVRDTRGVELGP
jgi:inosose dehydratase